MNDLSIWMIPKTIYVISRKRFDMVRYDERYLSVMILKKTYVICKKKKRVDVVRYDE